MEIKKSPKADLEKGKGLNFLLGLVVASRDRVCSFGISYLR